MYEKNILILKTIEIESNRPDLAVYTQRCVYNVVLTSLQRP